MPSRSEFGSRRVYYNNFAAHLLNAYSPNMLYPGLPYGWSDDDWRETVDMVAGFGFNILEFWLVPRLFCREGLTADFGRAFARQMGAIISYAHKKGLKVEALCGLATVGAQWHTLCPNVPEEWEEIQYLWRAWAQTLPGLDILGIFPGDPGACSRNGCTAETYIDRSIDVANLVTRTLPEAEVEFHTWGPPFFGWGIIEGPEDWRGEFLHAYQHTAWRFDRDRADRSMAHLVRRLSDFPEGTSIALNMGFDSDGNPGGERDARMWVAEVARTHHVQSWDFSLTEGENNVVPHYRFDRLFARRREERACGSYRGGICFTMTPLLNQLSLYESAHSFLDPDADGDALAADFYAQLFGPEGRDIVPYLPLFEVVRDWGNYHEIDLPRAAYHATMEQLVALLRGLVGHERATLALHPAPPAYLAELTFFAELFAALSGPAPDYDALRQRYWERVYRIYDHLPEHVDPRPHAATDRLIGHFAEMA